MKNQLFAALGVTACIALIVSTNPINTYTQLPMSDILLDTPAPQVILPDFVIGNPESDYVPTETANSI